MTASAHDVARAVIESQHRAGHTIDKKQLQKLLYFVQGTHYELWDEPAFREPVLAYRNGPVIRPVEQTYRNAYPEPTALITEAIGGHPVPDAVEQTVSLVLERYGNMPANELERRSKAGPSPWRETWGDRLPSEKGNDPIPDASISAWFARHGSIPDRIALTETQRDAIARLAAGDSEALSQLLP